MSAAHSAMYGLEYQTRCLSSVAAENNRHQWWVGTLNAKGANEVHLIEYTDDSHSISCINIYPHQHEVWSITPNPADRDVFISTYYTDGAYKASMWRAAGGDDVKSKSKPTTGKTQTKAAETSLTSVVDFDGHQGNIKAFVWHSDSDIAEGEPSEKSSSSSTSSLVSVDDLGLHLWNLPEGTSAVSTTAHAHLLAAEQTSSACFDPHHSTTLVSVDGRNIRAWDTRQLKETQLVPRAHEDAIRSIDYNPNKPYHIVTGGDDRRINLWDLRKPSHPLKILANHTHWVWTVRFNRFHDQLILSAGTELVNLWSIVSVSSAPLGELEEQQDSSADKLIKTYTDHDDSIYSIAWSAYDAWCFASLSYDGRVVVNQVPAAEKYKILL